MNRRLLATSALVGLACGLLAVSGPPATAQPSQSLSGRLEVLHEDRFDLGRADHRYALVDAAGRRTQLLFDDEGPHGLGARQVRVTGAAVRPGVLRVGSAAAVDVTDSGTGTAGGSTTATTAPATTKKVAVILFDFADSGLFEDRPVATATAQGAIFTRTAPSVHDFLGETSYGNLGIVGAVNPDGDVFEWVRVGASKADACDYHAWGQQARALAAAQHGFVDSAYDQVVHLMPKSTCAFGGIAQMPGKYSWTVLAPQGSADLVARLRQVTSHEYGHNLGIHHSGSATCTTRSGSVVTLGSCTGSVNEYGDPFSVMGISGHERQYTAFQKGRLGWLAPEHTLTVTASGTYTINTASLPGAGPKVLRVAAPKVSGSPRFYYFELRTPDGVFDAAATTLGMSPGYRLLPVAGLHVRYAGGYWLNAVTHLYDMTPETPTFRGDAALPLGDTFSAPAVGLRLTLKQVENGTATVEVLLGSGTKTRK
jgi:hypothetical protein